MAHSARCGYSKTPSFQCVRLSGASHTRASGLQIREAAVRAGHVRELDAMFSHQRYKSFGQIAIPDGVDRSVNFLKEDAQPYASMFVGRSVRLLAC